ncbi:rod shape-determining protein MreC [Wansuia hejianensis]|uniref:Cell shape-determining protein MreC n=1 Tax=Wansuia hejianensis TaxID=2763667 RepID=A0A926EYH5_9FIRM|nr:rod shape-determining protein MreC [Wansuia hejianensis]MBC8590825.1 rod shape-determining protein MreC [Wansuia hejianensis]
MYFFRKYKDRMIVASVAIILIIIIGVTSNDRLNLTKIENKLGNFLSPINKISTNIGKKLSDVFSNIGNIRRYPKENKELKDKIAELEEENRNLKNIIGKSDYLKRESELQNNTKFNLVSAQITSKESGNWYDRFLIDKGQKDGIKKGATVIQGIELEKDIIQEGIIGRVVDVGDNWAKVVSIIDEENRISFKNIRTQDGGILSGSIESELGGYLFDSKADIIVGDKLFTSGLGKAFVKDIYIGEVQEVINVEEELMKRIVVKPAIDFKKLYNVFVIMD